MVSVVYSALIGGYETPISQPHATELGVDFIMFTDDPSRFSGTGWNVVKISPRFPNDPVRSARFLKSVGHPVLDEFDQTMWIDNRVVLSAAAASLFDQLEHFDLVIPRHSYRASLIDEYQEVIASGYDDPGRVRQTYAMSCAAGVSMAAAPFWTGVLLRRRHEQMAACMRQWMDSILLGSRRDQLSIHAAIASVPLRTMVLGIDNEKSDYHEWIPNGAMSRVRSVQRWHPPSRSVGVRFSDLVRSRELTRRAARILEKFGIPLPTLDGAKEC